MDFRFWFVAAMIRTCTEIVLLLADPLKLAVLQERQELGLRLERHVADLVQEQAAAVGNLEPARSPLMRAR